VTAVVSTVANFRCYKMSAECMLKALFHVLVQVMIHCTLEASVQGNSFF